MRFTQYNWIDFLVVQYNLDTSHGHQRASEENHFGYRTNTEQNTEQLPINCIYTTFSVCIFFSKTVLILKVPVGCWQIWIQAGQVCTVVHMSKPGNSVVFVKKKNPTEEKLHEFLWPALETEHRFCNGCFWISKAKLNYSRFWFCHLCVDCQSLLWR